MSRLLAAIVVMGLIGVVIAAHSSGAASPRPTRAAAARVVVTPRLRRMLRAEMRKLRAEQPFAPGRLGSGQASPRRPPVIPLPPSQPGPLMPDRGVPCFVAGPSRCSESPCHEFVSRVAASVAVHPALPPRGRKACASAPPKRVTVSAGG